MSMTLGGCTSESASYRQQQTFSSPQAAARTLASAAESGDAAELSRIFGPEGKQVLSSGDPTADAHNRQVFAVAMSQGWKLDPLPDGARELVIGNEQWPFPIPLVNDSRGWWFDTLAGKDELLARRVGRNELATIGALRAYTAAQRAYAGQGHDGKSAGVYAQKVRSTPGRHDGLYWPVSGADEASPLGEFAASAASEGYTGGQAAEGLKPFRGYYFRILTRQGASAPGDAKDYIVNGEMTGGFGMLAWPAEYGNSGVMTFQVGPDGVVYERDLGPETAEQAGRITAYDPDATWRRSE